MVCLSLGAQMFGFTFLNFTLLHQVVGHVVAVDGDALRLVVLVHDHFQLRLAVLAVADVEVLVVVVTVAEVEVHLLAGLRQDRARRRDHLRHGRAHLDDGVGWVLVRSVDVDARV